MSSEGFAGTESQEDPIGEIKIQTGIFQGQARVYDRAFGKTAKGSWLYEWLCQALELAPEMQAQHGHKDSARVQRVWGAVEVSSWWGAGSDGFIMQRIFRIW